MKPCCHLTRAVARVIPMLAAFLIALLTGTAAQAQSEVLERVERIAIAACHKQFEPAPALARYVEIQPDLVLWIGDNVYADTHDDPGYLEACYAALAAKPAFKQMREAIPYMATWDDHDFGLNNFGKHYPLKAESKAIFRRFWKLTDEIPADRDGVYYARTFGTGDRALQIIMLDPRYNRDDPGDDADTLGEAQWAWLAEQLKTPARLRLIVSGFQILLDRESGSETWAKFPRARARLFNLISQNNIPGVLFITGDQHYGEVCRMRNAIGYDAIELQFAGINQIEEPEFNTNRVSRVSRSVHSYCTLDIQWERSEHDVPHVLFRIFDAMSNDVEVAYRVNLGELTQ